jgi:hypothetical protein
MSESDSLIEKEFFLLRFMNYMLYEIPAGPKVIKFNWAVNFQKCLMPFYITGLMIYYNNFSDAMFYYLILHGSYGKFFSFSLLVNQV